MNTKHKRYLGISILLMLTGVFKMYWKGVFENGEILWFNILIPFGMGVLFFLYTLVVIFTEIK